MIESSPEVFVASQAADLTQRVDLDKWVTHLRKTLVVAGVLVLGLLLLAFVLAGRYQHDVLVFRENAAGVAYMGSAEQSVSPAITSVEVAIGEWLRAVRTVPPTVLGRPDDLADQYQRTAVARTADGGPALTALRAFYGRSNPKILGLKLERSVNQPVDVARIGSTWSFRVTAVEKVIRDDKVTESTYSGTVTILPDPKIPGDASAASLNPAGIYVYSYDLPWTDPT